MAALALLSPAKAENLQQVMRDAVARNARVLAQQSRVLAAQESVAIGQAGYFPNIAVEGTARAGSAPGAGGLATVTTGSINGLVPDQRALSYSATLEQTIFDGFRTYYVVGAADATATAQRHDLAGVRQSIALAAVGAFADVIRTRTVLSLRKRSVASLGQDLEATRLRSANGDASGIDITQAAARLADASEALSASEADVDGAAAQYQAVIGHPPGQLRAPELPSNEMPESLTAAIATAQSTNPRILSARALEDAASHEIGVASSALAPKVVLDANYQRTFVQAGAAPLNDQTVSIEARVRIPLFDGGAALAQVRQAKYLRAARMQDVNDQRAAVVSDVSVSWAQLKAARKRISFSAKAVQAHRTALAGLRQARSAGQQTTLDVLNGERELIEAQVRQQLSERDMIVAAYTLLAITGQLDLP